MSRHVQKLLVAGLLIQTFPMLFHQYLGLNDFLNGFLRGLGLTLIVIALIFQQKKIKTACKFNEGNV